MSSTSKYRFIGVCLSRIQENFENDFIHSLIKRAGEYGYKVIIYNSFSDFYYLERYDIGEKYVFDLIDYDLLDGLVILGETIKNEELLNSIVNKAHEKGIYTVSVDKHLEGCFNIGFNYRTAFEAIVRHVIEEHNCRNISIMAGFKDNAFSDERIDCCRDILKEYDLELSDDRIMYGDFWSDPTARAMEEFFASGLSLPDAFICCNDSMAITVCSKLAEHGYSVPDDVIVTGFDGIIEEKYNIPRLTTARQDVDRAGEIAVDAIAAFINGTPFDKESQLDHTVTLSHSCGCKAIDYREATGQIDPLFKLSTNDGIYDGFMSRFANAAANTGTSNELADCILYYSSFFGYYYYSLCLKENFMRISDVYEDFIAPKTQTEDSGNRFILCERLFDKDYSPYYAAAPRHFEEAMDRINVFLHWSVHFQETSVGYGIMGLSTGCDDLTDNAITRHMMKYSHNVNHVLEIANSQSVMKQVIAKLQDLYIRDHVTGLYNRRGFYTEIGRYISVAHENKEKDTYMIIISIDMDGLKSINDNYGHSEGDIAIKAIADALVTVWGENEICSRFGGDEFTLASVCTENPEETGKELVNRICSHIEKFNETSGKPYKIKSSFGIYHEKITEDFIVDNLIKIADDLMYREKASHKERRYRSAVRND